MLSNYICAVKSLPLESILTSTKNASLIITDYLAMIYKNEKPRTASLIEVGRCWKMTLI